MVKKIAYPRGMNLGHLLAQCSTMQFAGNTLLVGMVLGALLGSATHCSVMCSPAIAAQMLTLPPQHSRRMFAVFYHAGRIGTYMLLGVASVKFQRMMFAGAFSGFSGIMLMLAGILFLTSAIFPARTHRCCSGRRQELQRRIDRLRFAPIQHSLRGALMGFMPCGMLVSALLVVGTVHNAAYAALLMLVFGLATVPMLQAAALTLVTLGRRRPKLGPALGRMALAANGIVLCGIGLNLVHGN